VFYPSTDWKDWEDLFPLDDRKNVVMDTHFYTAWNGAEKTIDPYCNRYRDTFSSLKGIGYPIWVGEWSLATDTCAMWLAGFNEGGQSQFECERVKCPYSYLPEPLNTDFDRTAAVLGPWGEADYSMIRYGMCPTDSSFFSDRDLAYLGQCALDSFDQSV
jgi:hypothetical protein